MSTKKILLTTISSPTHFEIQLALYYLKSYFQNSPVAHFNKVTIETMVFAYKDKIGWIIDAILKRKPNIIGFSCYVWNIDNILKISRLIKRDAPEIIIVLGGPEVSPRFEELLKQEKAIDIIVRGEGEEIFVDLIKSIAFKEFKLSDIKGIAYREKKGIIVTPARLLLRNINRIPSPYLTGMIKVKQQTRHSVPIETMRGCFYRCHYCYEHKNYYTVRYFSLERIERELKWVLAKKPSKVFILDSSFNSNLKRAKKILRTFIKYNKVSQLRLAIRAELLDEQIIELFSKARIYLLEIGFQSTNGRVLRAINRTLHKNIFKKNVRLLRKKNIPFQLQLIDSLPYDTYESFKQSLDWACSLRPTGIRIFRFMVLPGTYIRQHAKRLGIEYQSKPPYRTNRSNTMSADDLENIAELTKAVNIFCNNKFLIKTVHSIKNKLRIPFSRIFEEWIRWERSYKKRDKHLFANKKDCDYLEALTKIAPHFLIYLCNRCNKRSAYNSIYPTLKNDIINFFVARLTGHDNV